MRSKLAVFVLSALLSTGAIAQITEGDEARQRLVEQKIRLVETLLNAPAAKKAAARGGEAQTLLEGALKALAESRTALAGGNTDGAAQAADAAFKSLSAVSRRLSAENALSESAQRKNFDGLREQVATYRASVAELVPDPKLGPTAKTLLAQIDLAVEEAARFGNAGQLGEANKKLAETYKLAVVELSRIRAGQEVVMSLKFDTPADEYAYELKRFKSNEIMAEMLITEGKADGDRRMRVDGFVGEGRKLMQEAAQHAQERRYKEAVGLTEQATAQLVRALQAMGVPVF
ncbi:MAG: hypothetical protein M0P39_12870 [Rhodocyclaceae bacterium]|nr:hypothetical protein [Rhodocyclaceae bacterium]